MAAGFEKVFQSGQAELHVTSCMPVCPLLVFLFLLENTLYCPFPNKKHFPYYMVKLPF